MPKPIIGITWSSQPHYLRTLQSTLFREAYYLAIQQAGGIPHKLESHSTKVDSTHLDGILFIDRISRLKRSLYKRQLQKNLKK